MLDMLDRRVEEGALYKQKLGSLLIELQRLRSLIQQQSESLHEHLFLRFQRRLARLLGEQLDPLRLTHEAALLVEKSDITEELLHLQTHTDLIAQQLTLESPSGRKLDFLAQELSKEINILSSKSNNHQSAAAIIEFKSIVEKLRELISNIE